MVCQGVCTFRGIESTGLHCMLWPHVCQQPKSKCSNAPSAMSTQVTRKPCLLEEPQSLACHETKSVVGSVKPSDSHFYLADKNAQFLTTLTTCGLLAPGQMVLTDSAFACYQVL